MNDCSYIHIISQALPFVNSLLMRIEYIMPISYADIGTTSLFNIEGYLQNSKSYMSFLSLYYFDRQFILLSGYIRQPSSKD